MPFRILPLIVALIITGCTATHNEALPDINLNTETDDNTRSTKYKYNNYKKDQNQFTIETNDNEKSIEELTKFLKDNGFSITNKSQYLLLDYNNHKFLITPKISKGNLSRLVVYNLYNIKTEYQNKKELASLILKLNAELNLATFSISKDKKHLMLQSNITFVDTIEEKEIRKFIEYLIQGIMVTTLKNPDLIKYLE